MARSSPGVARVVAILNFMAEHPGQAFTLTDFVRALKLSRATCHALLAGLVDASYLYRTSDKSYVLGPALAAIGRVADEHLSPLRIAQPEMRALADAFDVVCTAAFLEDAEIVIRERSASRSNLGTLVSRGMRLPAKVPAATSFVSWSPREQADAFIDRIRPGLSAEGRQELHDGIAFTREAGFQVLLFNGPEARGAMGWLMGDADADAPVSVATRLEPSRAYLLAALSAPVFDLHGRIAFTLGLTGFAGERQAEEIRDTGQRLRAACDRITAFLGGRQG